MNTKIIVVDLPEYNLDNQPDYLNLGKKVDAEIENNLADGKYLYRAIGSDDHPGLNIEELIARILETGTDKYDPNRKEVCFDDFCMYDHDIQAGFFEINQGKIQLDDSYEYSTLFGDTIKKFYVNVLLDRVYRVRIDLLLIYEAVKLTKAKKTDSEAESVRTELEDCLYKFKDPSRKQDALVAIVKILR